VTPDEIIEYANGLPGTVVVTASEATGAPESAWGDSFIFYDPDDVEEDRRFPFATIVVSDYEGFDTLSNLNRPNVFRFNIAVGRRKFEELLGFGPSAHAQHHDEFDYAAADVLLPHPAYATHAWVSIVNPDELDQQAKDLLVGAYQLAVKRHRPAKPKPGEPPAESGTSE
jgi:hypothetical protein